jgi:hypothetical protein
VSIAFACAAAVYQPETRPDVPGFVLEKESRIEPSIGGTVKATNIFIARAAVESAEANAMLPMMVVAVRGTASRVDRMVNLNGESKELVLSVRAFESSDGSF